MVITASVWVIWIPRSKGRIKVVLADAGFNEWLVLSNNIWVDTNKSLNDLLIGEFCPASAIPLHVRYANRRMKIHRAKATATEQQRLRLALSLGISVHGSFPDFLTFEFVHLAGLNLSRTTYTALMVYIFNPFMHSLGIKDMVSVLNYSALSNMWARHTMP